MKCKCGSQFLPLGKDQILCPTCTILNLKDKKEKNQIKNSIMSIKNRVLEANIIFQKMGRGDINHRFENIIHSIAASAKLLEINLKLDHD